MGGGGYTAGELIRILQYHPAVDIAFVFSTSQGGKRVDAVHEDLVGESDLVFAATFEPTADVLFLCLNHGQSAVFMAEHHIPAETLVIDLGNDFRLDPQWVYGLPELNRNAISRSRRIANCGCFATAIQLALLPLAAAQTLDSEVHIHAITGSTGAGQALSPTSHFSWRNNNLSVYKAFQHQHLPEIQRSLVQLQPQFGRALNFIPLRGDFPRGIFATLYLEGTTALDELQDRYREYYRSAPFTHLASANPHLKQVVNTNKCLIHLERHDNKIFIISLIDNLVKGASGQAVQNMNLACGLPETLGLQLKSLAF